MANASLEQTIIKLRERNEFLERANAKLGEDWRRMREQFDDIGRILGGLGGLTLAGAVAARLGKKERAEAKRDRKADKFAERRAGLLADNFPRDTGVISDDVLAELIA
jgi:hypothetical protein